MINNSWRIVKGLVIHIGKLSCDVDNEEEDWEYEIFYPIL